MVTNRFMETTVKIVYQETGLIVVSKPAGMVTTNEGRPEAASIENWSKMKGNRLDRGGVVHRLDKGTSGLVVVAQDEKSWVDIKKQFKERSVKKTYWALLSGLVPQQGEINLPIGRSMRGFSKFGVNINGKPAKTEYKVIKIYGNPLTGRNYSLIEVNLTTGRTHQIRVHFNFLKLPIVGDRLYGGEQIAGLDRQFLHAKEISYISLATKKKVTVTDDLASDLELILNSYEEK